MYKLTEYEIYTGKGSGIVFKHIFVIVEPQDRSYPQLLDSLPESGTDVNLIPLAELPDYINNLLSQPGCTESYSPNGRRFSFSSGV